MIRVYFAERASEDVAGNHAAVGAAGELMISQVEIGLQRNPNPPFGEVPVVTASTFLRVYGPASRWLYAEPVHDESAAKREGPDVGESTAKREAELEEAIS